MTPERFRRIHEIFVRASSSDRESRADLLNLECGEDTELRLEVERMLDIDSGPPEFASDEGVGGIASRRIADLLADESRPRVPQRIGPFAVEGIIGMGGMGAVYRAVQDSPRRPVAIKVMRGGLVSRAMIRRFVQESEILGRLDHPGIAHIYQAGVWKDGDVALPYFAMELVEGEPLMSHATTRRLSIRDRLALFCHICDAVQQAHQRGIIHRDLKPGNILVTPDGRPKVLDFGIARATDRDVNVTTVGTDVGLILGTLPYMSPEQLAGDGRDIDTRADVYALGVVLFELLSERLPISLEGQSMIQAARTVAEAEPLRLGTLDRHFRGDLETIANKALEKDRARRYQSAGELAADIGRYLKYEPIAARPSGTLYQLRKLARRNRPAAIAVGIAVLLLVLGITGTTIGMVSAIRSRGAAEESKRETDEVADFQAALIRDLNPGRIGRFMMQEVQDRARQAMTERGLKKEQVESKVAELTGMIRDANPTTVGAAVLEKSLITPALGKVERDFASQPLVRARLLDTLASALSSLGQYRRAVKPHADAVALRREHLGPDHLESLDSMHRLGLSQMMAPDLAGAEATFREESDRAARVLGAEHLLTLRALKSLGSALRGQGRYGEAEKLFRRVLEDQTRTLGPAHEETLITQRMLGIHLEMTGDYKQAEVVLRDCLELNRLHRTQDHSETLTTAFGLAKTLLKMKKLDEAEEQFRFVLERRQKHLGENHLLTFESHMSLCRVAAARGRHDEVERAYSALVERAIKVLAEDTSLITTMHYNRALSLERLKRWPEAAVEMRWARDCWQRQFGRGGEDTLRALKGLGRISKAMDRFGELESGLLVEREAAARGKPSLPWKVGEIDLQLGAVCAAAGDFTRAEQYLLKAYSAAKSSGAPPALDDQCGAQLAALYAAWQRAQPSPDTSEKAAKWKRLNKSGHSEPGTSDIDT